MRDGPRGRWGPLEAMVIPKPTETSERRVRKTKTKEGVMKGKSQSETCAPGKEHIQLNTRLKGSGVLGVGWIWVVLLGGLGGFSVLVGWCGSWLWGGLFASWTLNRHFQKKAKGNKKTCKDPTGGGANDKKPTGNAREEETYRWAPSVMSAVGTWVEGKKGTR